MRLEITEANRVWVISGYVSHSHVTSGREYVTNHPLSEKNHCRAKTLHKQSREWEWRESIPSIPLVFRSSIAGSFTQAAPILKQGVWMGFIVGANYWGGVKGQEASQQVICITAPSSPVTTSKNILILCFSILSMSVVFKLFRLGPTF